MKTLSPARQVKRRDDAFAEKSSTKIWQEIPCKDNPYITSEAYCHGYEIHDLMENCSFSDVFFLLYKSELPTKEQKELLEKLMIGLINPGPRHAATRAAMNTGVGKTNPVHILPISTIVMGGERDCAGAIEATMRFFRKNFRKCPEKIASEIAAKELEKDSPSRWHNVSGFGQHYGGLDIQAHKLAEHILQLPAAGDILRWAAILSKTLNNHNAGWLSIGVASAAFSDLGFHPKLGGPLFQLMSAPGLLAHGFEYVTKPLTAMPYVKDEDYVIKNV